MCTRGRTPRTLNSVRDREGEIRGPLTCRVRDTFPSPPTFAAVPSPASPPPTSSTSQARRTEQPAALGPRGAGAEAPGAQAGDRPQPSSVQSRRHAQRPRQPPQNRALRRTHVWLACDLGGDTPATRSGPGPVPPLSPWTARPGSNLGVCFVLFFNKGVGPDTARPFPS